MTSRAKWMVLPLSIVTLIVAAIYVLRIDQVRVTGLSTLSARQVIRTSELEIGERILWVRLSAAARRIEALPAVRDVAITRSLPGTVVIHVDEREPLARLDGRNDLAVDVEGRMFPAPTGSTAPILQGWSGTPKPGGETDRVSRFVLDWFSRFPEQLRAPSERIVIGTGLTIVLRGGTEVRFGRYEDLRQKANAAAAVLASQATTPLAYVDVRSASVPVVMPAGQPTPTPSGGPTGPPPATTQTPTPATPPP